LAIKLNEVTVQMNPNKFSHDNNKHNHMDLIRGSVDEIRMREKLESMKGIVNCKNVNEFFPLPDEMVICIFRYLDDSDVLNCARVCPRWKKIIFRDTKLRSSVKARIQALVRQWENKENIRKRVPSRYEFPFYGLRSPKRTHPYLT